MTGNKFLKKWLMIPLFLLLLTGCGNRSGYAAEFFAMDTVMQVHIYGADHPAALAKTLIGQINTLETVFSVTQPESEVSRLNAGEILSPSPALHTLLDKTIALHERTNGCLDPTIYPIVRLWGFTTGSYRVPTVDERARALALTGVQHIHTNGNTLSLSDGAKLDFGAVAKGYAADCCAALLEDAGVSGILTLGGNVQTVGQKPDGSNWRIGITDPAQPERSIAALSLQGSVAVVTSGSYQRYFTQDSIRYSHIMDPKTGASANTGLSSVTIIARSGLLADALSTALFVMGTEQAEAFWRTSDDFELLMITDEGHMLISEGLTDVISTDKEYQVMKR